MKLDSLNELYIEELKDVYDAENQLMAALPKLGEAASSPELRETFESHLEQTRGHIARLDQIFEELQVRATRRSCAGMKGILTESEKLMKEKNVEPQVLDAGLLAAAQRVEHYEIASYGTLRAFAEALGARNAAKLLAQTLAEEKKTNQKLSDIAESTINAEAAHAGQEEAGEEEEG